MAFGIPNIERVVSNFLEGGTGITAIRSLEVDKRYLWVVDFVDGLNSIKPPAPFNELFPASDITITMAQLNTSTLTFGQTDMQIPKNSSGAELSITFYDDEKRTLLKWFFDWINLDIKNNGQFMSGIKDRHKVVAKDSFGNDERSVYPARQIRLGLLDSYRSDIAFYNYLIFPKGNLDFAGTQASEATQYTVSFAIVDDLSSKPISNAFGGFSFNTVKQVLGRFI